MLQDGGAVVPVEIERRVDQVFAGRRGQRDADDVLDPQLRRVRAIVARDAFERVAVVADAVELVHCQQHVAHAEQGRDRGMAEGLRKQPLGRINEHDRQVRDRGSGSHVARVLDVPRTVGDQIAAAPGLQVSPGHVDGDALLALGVQAIEQQRVVGFPAAGAVAGAGARPRRALVVGYAPGVVQQAPDQGALAVVHAAAGDDAQDPRFAIHALHLGRNAHLVARN